MKKSCNNYIPDASFYEAGSPIRPDKGFVWSGAICMLIGVLVLSYFVCLIIKILYLDEIDYIVLGALLCLLLIPLIAILSGLRKCIQSREYLSIDSNGVRAYVCDVPVDSRFFSLRRARLTYHDISWSQIDGVDVQQISSKEWLISIYSTNSQETPLIQFEAHIFKLSIEDIIEILNYYYAVANNEAPGEHKLI